MSGRILIWLLVLCCCACNNQTDEGYPCTREMRAFDNTFGIAYDNPQIYLVPSEQSDLDSIYRNEIRKIFGNPDLTFSGIFDVIAWFNQIFSFNNMGGSMIAQYTVNDLYHKKEFYGCHSAALIISSVLRTLGYPSVMVETASFDWAKEYLAGTSEIFSGHVMSEIYVEGRWILLDNNGAYVFDYNYLNPYLNCTTSNSAIDAAGSFVIAKGIDIWSYGVHGTQDTHDLMIRFAENLGCFEGWFDSVNYAWSIK